MQNHLLVSTTPFKPALKSAFEEAGWRTMFCTPEQLDEVLVDLSDGDVLLVDASQSTFASQLRLAGSVASNLRVLLRGEHTSSSRPAAGYARLATMVALDHVGESELVQAVSDWMGRSSLQLSIKLWDVLEAARIEKMTCELLIRTTLGVSGAIELRDGEITSVGSRERSGVEALWDLDGSLVEFGVLPLEPATQPFEPLDIASIPRGDASPDAAIMLRQKSGMLGDCHRVLHVHVCRDRLGQRGPTGEYEIVWEAPAQRDLSNQSSVRTYSPDPDEGETKRIPSADTRLRRIEEFSIEIDEPETERFDIDEPATAKLDFEATDTNRWDIDEPETARVDIGSPEKMNWD